MTYISAFYDVRFHHRPLLHLPKINIKTKTKPCHKLAPEDSLVNSHSKTSFFITIPTTKNKQTKKKKKKKNNHSSNSFNIVSNHSNLSADPLARSDMSNSSSFLLSQKYLGRSWRPAYSEYQSELWKVFQNIQIGSLANAGESLMNISKWLLSNVCELGMFWHLFFTYLLAFTRLPVLHMLFRTN